MINQINLISKTQMIVIEPDTRSTSVIDAGPIGPIDLDVTGEPGTDAISAYQIALNHGFVGTLTQWLTSLDASPEEEIVTVVGGLHIEQVTSIVDIFGGVHVTDL